MNLGQLNSLQLESLLKNYKLEMHEPVVPSALINQVVLFATEHADQLTREDGREVTLEEDPDLQVFYFFIVRLVVGIV